LVTQLDISAWEKLQAGVAVFLKLWRCDISAVKCSSIFWKADGQLKRVVRGWDCTWSKKTRLPLEKRVVFFVFHFIQIEW